MDRSKRWACRACARERTLTPLRWSTGTPRGGRGGQLQRGQVHHEQLPACRRYTPGSKGVQVTTLQRKVQWWQGVLDPESREKSTKNMVISRRIMKQCYVTWLRASNTRMKLVLSKPLLPASCFTTIRNSDAGCRCSLDFRCSAIVEPPKKPSLTRKHHCRPAKITVDQPNYC